VHLGRLLAAPPGQFLLFFLVAKFIQLAEFFFFKVGKKCDFFGFLVPKSRFFFSLLQNLQISLLGSSIYATNVKEA
jgi:hypothetical protein